MRLWNIEAGSKVAVRLASAAHPLRIYSCGPTVYAPPHLGHGRAYVTLDLMRRSRLDRNCLWAMGITDVDDKIIATARAQAISVADVAQAQEKLFFRDLDDLGVLRPDAVLRVSEHIPQIIEMIQRLLDRDVGYLAGSQCNHVYFDVVRWGHNYGRLDRSRGLQGAAMEPAGSLGRNSSLSRDKSGNKRDARDFALWKPVVEGDAAVDAVWGSPWGPGRPGWHIECSAMSTALFGGQLDIHTGGVDLRFPHHENEIAQTEAACVGPRPWCSQWVHLGHLHQTGRKMSKSEKNFVSIRQFLDQGGTASEFRIFCLMHHYAAPVEWSDPQHRAARQVLAELAEFLQRAAAASATRDSKGLRTRWTPLAAKIHNTMLVCFDKIDTALDDDFGTPQALHALRAAIRECRHVLAEQVVGKHRELDNESAISVVVDFARRVRILLESWGIWIDGGTESANSESDNGSLQLERDEAVDALVQFRGLVRQLAVDNVTGQHAELCNTLLTRCDEVRSAANKAGLQIQDGGTQHPGRWNWRRP